MKSVALSLAILFSGGAYGQDLIWVFLNTKVNKESLPEEQVKKIMDGHMANINRLAKEGKLLAAGPFDGGGGIFIFKSRSRQEVNEWLSTDPGIQAKRWDIEVFLYIPGFGSVCSVGENFEMTNYYFVRYSSRVAKPTIGTIADALVALHTYIKSWISNGAVIAEGSLGEEEGSILVLKEEPAQDRLDEDPAVKSGALRTELKKLFIAKGSFCEPKP